VVSTADEVEAIRARLPELPAAARSRLVAAGLSPEQAVTVVGGGSLAVLDDAIAAGADPVTAANRLTGEVAGYLGSAGITLEDSGLTGTHLAELEALVTDGTLSTKLAKQVLVGVLDARGAKGPARIAEEEGLQQVSDEGELRAIVEQVVADNAGTVDAIRGGNDKAIGALVGQVMKATRGQADPRKTNELLREVIG
jgi:aspartyl-tRNA(Asn)/glutamyl-tRNA(Gln) amidotransferase subunit B